MRNKRLDVLRGIAVLLVVFYHGSIRNRFTDAGWAGVDLFFVLSGFLISGLLFAEYNKNGTINFKRFIIRRGLKLYPAFYLFLLLTLIAESLFHHVRPLGTYINEMLYLQNYRESLWPHTWSLAVEEHFYIFLPLLLCFLISTAACRAGRKDAFRSLPGIFLFVAAVCLAFRFANERRLPLRELSNWQSAKSVFAPTHERMDSLFFGVLLGYLYHFRAAFLDRLTSTATSRRILGAACTVALSAAFVGNVRFLVTLGYTLMYLGFGILLILSLKVRNVLPLFVAKIVEPLGSVIAFVGMYSYSIYLWHIPVSRWEPIVSERVFRVKSGHAVGYLSYLAVSVGLGVLMSRLVEYPILRIRDRLIPGVQPQAISRAVDAQQQQQCSQAQLSLNGPASSPR